ncbi:hypothetical protein P9112_001697 [Eukaryota sp. TZLM1-RC]
MLDHSRSKSIMLIACIKIESRIPLRTFADRLYLLPLLFVNQEILSLARAQNNNGEKEVLPNRLLLSPRLMFSITSANCLVIQLKGVPGRIANAARSGESNRFATREDLGVLVPVAEENLEAEVEALPSINVHVNNNNH